MSKDFPCEIGGLTSWPCLALLGGVPVALPTVRTVPGVGWCYLADSLGTAPVAATFVPIRAIVEALEVQWGTMQERKNHHFRCEHHKSVVGKTGALVSSRSIPECGPYISSGRTPVSFGL